MVSVAMIRGRADALLYSYLSYDLLSCSTVQPDFQMMDDGGLYNGFEDFGHVCEGKQDSVLGRKRVSFLYRICSCNVCVC